MADFVPAQLRCTVDASGDIWLECTVLGRVSVRVSSDNAESWIETDEPYPETTRPPAIAAIAKPGDLIVLVADREDMRTTLSDQSRAAIPDGVGVVVVDSSIEIQQYAVESGDLFVFSLPRGTSRFLMERVHQVVKKMLPCDAHLLVCTEMGGLDRFTAADLKQAGLARQGCPDGGKCHHRCPGACWRVANCGPLSGVYADNEWPEDIVRTHCAEGAQSSDVQS